MEGATSNVLPQFQRVGHDLFSRGLVSSHGGNLSIKAGERLIITRQGSMLAHLGEQDLVETGVDKDDKATPLASTELSVHRAIYRQTSASAVVHAHPPHAVALSLVEKEIIPVDMEGSLLLSKVPVLGWNMRLGPDKLAEEIAPALREYKVVLLYGHGCFAAGQSLDEAHHWVSTLEESCRIICLLRALSPARKIDPCGRG